MRLRRQTGVINADILEPADIAGVDLIERDEAMTVLAFVGDEPTVGGGGRLIQFRLTRTDRRSICRTGPKAGRKREHSA